MKILDQDVIKQKKRIKSLNLKKNTKDVLNHYTGKKQNV